MVHPILFVMQSYACMEIRQFGKLPEEGQSLMRAAMSQLNLCARVYHCILKLAEALQDRPKLMHSTVS
jgi:predicted ATPase with chaperone activity